VRLDGIGTVFGEGGDPRAPALLMGSHTDTQPQGGWLDGALGVVYALEAARVLHESGAPGAWAVIDFQDEEGRFSTLTASRAFAGVLPAPPLHLPELAAGRAEAGLSGRPILTHTTAREPTSDRPSERSPQPWLGFFEAHIEQGPRLERANASLGVVTAIVGMRQLILTFSGRQDHAGGCPMDERADAGLAAMRYAAALDASIHEACAGDACDGAVWTFPDLKGFVSHSTVPGNATLTFQFRAPSEPTLDLLDRLARDHCEADAARRLAEGLPPLSSARPVTCSFREARKAVPVARMDDGLVSCVDSAARAAARSPLARPGGVLTMPSRAIHDAAMVATVMPTSMLFVPSVDGVSHSFDEHTQESDLAAGAIAYVGAAAGMVLQECAGPA
jgi:N-carbamoyl-L-amino-acid hydrolase